MRFSPLGGTVLLMQTFIGTLSLWTGLLALSRWRLKGFQWTYFLAAGLMCHGVLMLLYVVSAILLDNVPLLVCLEGISRLVLVGGCLYSGFIIRNLIKSRFVRNWKIELVAMALLCVVFSLAAYPFFESKTIARLAHMLAGLVFLAAYWAFSVPEEPLYAPLVFVGLSAIVEYVGASAVGYEFRWPHAVYIVMKLVTLAYIALGFEIQSLHYLRRMEGWTEEE